MNYLDKEDIDWILLINNDVKIDSKFIERLRSLKDRNTIYSPVITNHDSDIVQNTGGKLVLLYGGTINLNKGVQIQDIKKVDPDFLSGCCLFFHKEVLEKVGYLDESYGSYYEDVEWCFRAREKGVSLEVLWDLTLPHYHSMSTSNNSGFKDYLIAKNSIKFAKSDLNKFNASVFIFFSMLTGFLWVLPRPKNLPYFFRGVKDGLL
jgi:GT2 family glycosyltransferase